MTAVFGETSTPPSQFAARNYLIDSALSTDSNTTACLLLFTWIRLLYSRSSTVDRRVIHARYATISFVCTLFCPLMLLLHELGIGISIRECDGIYNFVGNFPAFLLARPVKIWETRALWREGECREDIWCILRSAMSSKI